jgi:hypothetical protein
MATFQIEIDDATGQPKEMPEALKKHVDTLVDTGFKARHKELRTSLERELEGKRGAGDVGEAERARLKALEEEVERHRIADAERKADYEKAQKIRDEAEAKREEERQKATAEKDKELERRTGRLKDMARGEIKIAAKTLGARDESLDELAKLLGADLDLDADLSPFVKGADGKPATDKDGKPVTIEGHVKAYLDTHPHHRSATAGAGGGARGGASQQHLTSEARDAQSKFDAVKKRVDDGDRSDVTLNELFEADRALKKAQAGGK